MFWVECMCCFRLKINPIAPRKAKIVHSFGLSECNMVKTKEKEK